MKLRLLLSLLTLTAIASSMQSVSAQEARSPRGARFDFAPNTYRMEQSRVPKAAPDPEHNVRAGAVPSNNILGIDPSMLAKPAPPPPIVAARPAMTSVTPQMFVPRTNSTFSPNPNFNPMFGKPQVAQLPAPVPQQAVAMPMAPKPPIAASAPAAVRRHVNTAVAGRLMKPVHRNIYPVAAQPAVASYGKDFGYVPGPLLPSASGGMSTQTQVRGVLMTKPKHR